MTTNGAFLRWAGSKRKLLPTLSPFWKPSYGCYIEPFMGSACLFFAIKPHNARLSDLNQELVHVFKSIKKNATAVSEALHKLRKGERNYYSLRKTDPSDLSPVDAAARFIYLNRFCFNGLYRTNNSGQFNVPYGASKSGDLPTKIELMAASEALLHAELSSGDFEKTLSEAKKNDFVYLDPPFAVENRRIFKQYGPQTFGLEDLKRLRKCVLELDRRGVAFVMSYAYCREALELFNDWPKRKVLVRRNIAGFSKSRRTSAELLISNRF